MACHYIVVEKSVKKYYQRVALESQAKQSLENVRKIGKN